jgi:hypothetical protein
MIVGLAPVLQKRTKQVALVCFSELEVVSVKPMSCVTNYQNNKLAPYIDNVGKGTELSPVFNLAPEG